MSLVLKSIDRTFTILADFILSEPIVYAAVLRSSNEVRIGRLTKDDITPEVAAGLNLILSGNSCDISSHLFLLDFKDIFEGHKVTASFDITSERTLESRKLKLVGYDNIVKYLANHKVENLRVVKEK